MDRQTKESILAAAIDADENDVDEYERLLAERFTIDPNMPAPVMTPEAAAASPLDAEDAEGVPPTREAIEARIRELRQKLYPGKRK